MTVGCGVRSGAIKVMAERSVWPNHVKPLCVSKNHSLPNKMSATLPTIFMSDKEDAWIHEHEISIKKAKEERQRQWEERAQRVEEAKRVQRQAEAEKAQMEEA